MRRLSGAWSVGEEASRELRDGSSSLEDAYAKIEDGELWLIGSDIPEYAMGNRMNHKPKRPRKLLLHQEELRKQVDLIFNIEDGVGMVNPTALAASLENAGRARIVAASPVGQRFYEGACAVCHEVGGPPLFGSRPSLALNSNLHAGTPDNLIQVILHGIAAPVSSDLGYMPAFKDSLSDEHLAELVSYLRQQFAPDKPPWKDVPAAIKLLRQRASR